MEKLIRDNIGLRLADTEPDLVRVASREEMPRFLMMKLHEELAEVAHAKSEAQVIEELADLITACQATAEFYGLRRKVEEVIKEKGKEKGRFKGCYVLKVDG